MRKFKHKITRDIIILKDNSHGAHFDYCGDQLIPRRFIENSNDWEEITNCNHNFKDGSIKCPNCNILLDIIPPLFTTKDEVNIYEGDKYYMINKNAWMSYDYIANKNLSYKHDFIIFSTKEAAEEYIIMNRPCLSIKDISNKYLEYGIVVDISIIKELVKSKLK